jgi:hypothetical protein
MRYFGSKVYRESALRAEGVGRVPLLVGGALPAAGADTAQAGVRPSVLNSCIIGHATGPVHLQ